MQTTAAWIPWEIQQGENCSWPTAPTARGGPCGICPHSSVCQGRGNMHISCRAAAGWVEERGAVLIPAQINCLEGRRGPNSESFKCQPESQEESELSLSVEQQPEGTLRWDLQEPTEGHLREGVHFGHHHWASWQDLLSGSLLALSPPALCLTPAHFGESSG